MGISRCHVGELVATGTSVPGIHHQGHCALLIGPAPTARARRRGDYVRRRSHFISSLEIVSPPLRVHILIKTSLLICEVTGRTLPSQNAKLTALGCLLAQ